MDLINKLVASFKKRLLLCCEQEGKQIGTLLNSYDEEEIDFEPMNEDQLIEIISTHCPNIEDVDDSPKREFSIEEDQLLLKLYGELGPKWTKMNTYFDN